MTKPKPRPKRAVDAVQAALEAEQKRRGNGMKPIEIVKVAISAYQKYQSQGEADGPSPQVGHGALAGRAPHADRAPLADRALQAGRTAHADRALHADRIPTAQACAPAVESDDRVDLRRGTQASVDRLLFNANYWCAAYEDRIVAACSDPDDARTCLKAASVWTTHALKLNTLPPDEVTATFERFCPPFAVNNRRGSGARTGAGKGPVADFKRLALSIAEHETPDRADALRSIVEDMETEARIYERLGASGSLDALYAVLPAWCLQERIDLVRGNWWDDCDVMNLVIEQLARRFVADGFGEPICQYFLDSCREVIDAYQRDISTEQSDFAARGIGELVELVHSARQSHPDSETDGYGNTLPAWLICKEQLIWNTIVCSIYGPSSTRPLLVDTPSMILDNSYANRTDIITELSQISFTRYITDRAAAGADEEFSKYADQPVDLRNSSIEHIRSIPDKLEILGYGIMPAGSCYPEQRVNAFTASEIECLAILEHRRWLRERALAGWSFSTVKDVEAKKSPYIVPWESLPDRAREWNRSAIRNIPSLLANVNLAIVRE